MSVDVERMVAERLMAETGTQCVLEVPRDRPTEFYSVELSGGQGGRFTDDVQLHVQAWAPTRKRAAELMREARDAVPSLMEEDCVFRAEDTGAYRWYDPDSGTPRYQMNLELTICE